MVLSAMVLACGALAACSSDDASPASTASTAGVATDGPTTTTITTTPPPTTDAPTTTAPTPTDAPADTLAADVEADLLEAFGLGREASQDPFNAEKEQAALDRRVGVIAENLAATLADYRARNYAIRPNEGVPASVTVEGEPTFLGPSNEVAEVQICEVNSWILVEVGAGPNGTDAVVNPDVVAYRNEFIARNVDGVWRIEGGNELGRFPGETACPPE